MKFGAEYSDADLANQYVDCDRLDNYPPVGDDGNLWQSNSGDRQIRDRSTSLVRYLIHKLAFGQTNPKPIEFRQNRRFCAEWISDE